jgi:hypothetical protein
MNSKLRDIVGCIVILPLMGLASVTIPIWGPIILLVQWWQERSHRSRHQKIGRFIAWEQLLSASRAGSLGTLIFEQGQKLPIRVWWTPDEEIEASAPAPMPKEDELDYFGHEIHPFTRWVYDRYIGPTGSARLTDYYPPGVRGFATVANFSETGFKRILPTVRLWKKLPTE